MIGGVEGALSRAERFGFARRAVIAQLAALPGVLRARMGRASSGAFDGDADPPDSALAVPAERHVAQYYSVNLYNHCLRCWYFSDFFARLDGRCYEPELLYVSCLFHDIALTDGYRDQRPYACFAVEGGQAAGAWLAGQGAERRFTDAVADAISRHMDVRVDAHSAAGETYLLHEAAHLDVAGTRADEVPAAYARAVSGRFPRTGFAEEFCQAMRYESVKRKSSRAAVLWKVGMRIPIVTNPLDMAAGSRP